MREMCDWRSGLHPDATTAFDLGLEPPWGIAHCNPGNLLVHPCWAWRGQCHVYKDNRLGFLSPEYGIRAMSQYAYMLTDFYNIKTLDKLACAWLSDEPLTAPALADYVGQVLGVHTDAHVDFHAIGRKTITAMIAFLNGVEWRGSVLRNFYMPETISEGVLFSHIL